jgi:heterodisulfide reductase subunit A
MNSQKTILTIGAGIAGIEASSVLSGLGYRVILVEKDMKIGGKVNNYYHLFPNGRPADEVRNYIDEKCQKHDFTIYKNTEIKGIKKTSGKFSLTTSHDDVLKADAVILANGFDYFEAQRKEEYGYKIYDNVITSVDLEEKLRMGFPITTKNGETPKRIGFVHCVGSRDEKSGNHYCSRICCVTGVKQAMELNKMYPGADIYCFYIDLRMYSVEFESIYRNAQEQFGIQFIRGKVSEVSENSDGYLQVKAEDTLIGRPLKMEMDLLVLLVGMTASQNSNQLKSIAGIETNKHNFFQSNDWQLHKNHSSQPGIFLAGACNGPMSIDESIEHARSAAIEVHNYLSNGY